MGTSTPGKDDCPILLADSANWCSFIGAPEREITECATEFSRNGPTNSSDFTMLNGVTRWTN
jgi:hypothetical protein